MTFVLRCILLASVALPLGMTPPPTIDGLWRYTLARCPGGDVVPSGYSQILVIQGAEAAQETSVEGCGGQTRGITRIDTKDATVLRYTGAATVCTPFPGCIGSFTTTFEGRTSVAMYACQGGLAAGESGPLTLVGPDTLEIVAAGERACVSVYTRVPGPTGALP